MARDLALPRVQMSMAFLCLLSDLVRDVDRVIFVIYNIF